MTQFSLQMYKLTVDFSKNCIYESGGGICLMSAWLVWTGAFIIPMGVKLENSVLLLYRYDILFSIFHVWVQASIFTISNTVWRPWPCSCSSRSSWVLFRRWPAGPEPAWILVEEDANLKPLGEIFTIQGRVEEESYYSCIHGVGHR